jgi:prepilin-type N-terminal cleavage/methylation domain-containing protein
MDLLTKLARRSAIRLPCRAGFTLLEMLIAMALTAMVLLMVSSSLSFTTRMWLKAENEKETTGETSNLIDLLGMQVGSYYAFDSGKIRNLHVLQGTESSLFIVTSHSVKSLHGGAPVIAGYVFDQSAGMVRYYEVPVDWGKLDELLDFVRAPQMITSEAASYEVSAFALEYVADEDEAPYREWQGDLQELRALVVRWRESTDASLQTRVISAGYLDFLS